MAKISGTLSNDARIIIVKETDWSLESNTEKSAGAFEVDGLDAGAKTLIARKSDGETICFGNVIAVGSSFQATGGTITFFENYKIHTFLSSDTFQVLSGSKTLEYLIVGAGGGAGGGITNVSYPGGGGGGQVLAASILRSTGSYNIVVGNGGAFGGSNASGERGGNSSAFGFSSEGGYGAYVTGHGGNSGNGHIGGAQIGQLPWYCGGGAGDDGDGGSGNPEGGVGGNGTLNSISGEDIYYGAGGGGGPNAQNGLGGGPAPSFDIWIPSPNRGGGGNSPYTTAGGSGIVIIRYLIN